MFFPILLGFFTAFLALAFALLHLLASPFWIKKEKSHFRKSISPHRELPCDCISHPLLLLADCHSSYLADWLWLDLLRSLLEWETQRKLPSSSPPDSDRDRSGPYHLVSHVIGKAQVFFWKLELLYYSNHNPKLLCHLQFVVFLAPNCLFLKSEDCFPTRTPVSDLV